MVTRSISVLGATGSIGLSTLDVVRRHPDRFSVYALTASTRAEELAVLTPPKHATPHGCDQPAPRLPPLCVHVQLSGRVLVDVAQRGVAVRGLVAAVDGGVDLAELGLAEHGLEVQIAIQVED